MADSLYRIALGSGARHLALGPAGGAPERLLPAEFTLDRLLSGEGDRFWDTVESAASSPVPAGFRILAPIETQEVWAAGVTYAPSRDARKAESPKYGAVYDAVFGAMRPELFYKSSGTRVRGPGDEIAIRSDSTWNVPEPELALVLSSRCEIVAYTIGNDVSSRSIEGANPLYLPQAKYYDGSCAIGPCLVRPASVALEIELEIRRSNDTLYLATTSTSAIVRTFPELAAWLGRALGFPVGALLLTGTGIIPPAAFSLRQGDVVVISIDGIGKLTNTARLLDCGDPPVDESIFAPGTS